MDIVDARKKARYSQEAAAGELGISRPTYAKLEKNPEIIEIGMAKKIADLFGVTIDQLNFFDSDCN